MKTNARGYRIGRWAGLGAIAAGIAAAHTVLFLLPWGQALEMRFGDLWFNRRGAIAPPPNVVVVLMDDSSREELGLLPNQPWPRSVHARLLQRLARAGTRSVVFDVLFLGPSADPAADKQFADAMMGVPTVLGAEYYKVDQDRFLAEGVNLPLQLLAAQARSVGLVNLPEHQGYLRCFWTHRPEATHGLPSLVEAAAGKPPQDSGLPRAEDLLNYYGPPGTIPTYSYHQAIEGGPVASPAPPPATGLSDSADLPRAPSVASDGDDVFRNQVVFVSAETSEKDAFLTPFDQYGRMPGVEIQATATANLMTGHWIRRQPRWLEATVLALLAAGLGILLTQLKPQWGAVAMAGLATSWTGLAYGAFLARLFVPGAVLVAAVLPGIWAASTLHYYAVTRRSQRQLERAFQFYLSPEMARTVAHDPSALRLGGEEVVATALFTDIEGFTTIAEQLSPAQVGSMLNAYFTEVMNAIFEKRGTLIQFVGDGVFALWGAPIKTFQHAQLACEAALAIQTEIERFNSAGRFPPLPTRIGIHTGPVVVGNFGSARRFNFGALGDSINLASRVESLNKHFDTQILITDSVRSALDSRIAPVELGTIRVAGKQQAVGIHALFLKPIDPEQVNQWNQALTAFRARHWDVAAAGFAELARGRPPLQKAAAFYGRQIATLHAAPPPPDWHGEIVFASK